MFKKYKLEWMTKPPGIYEAKLVREFYVNYEDKMKSMTPSRKEKYIRKQPILDMVIMRGKLVDISEKKISNMLFGVAFELALETPNYDYHMNELKKLIKLYSLDQIMHFTWLIGHSGG